MGSLLVVDGSGVCRAPIVAFTLEQRLQTLGGSVEVRGLAAATGSTMCENAASRIGHSGPAIGFFGAYRAIPLSVADVANADLVLTAERVHRSAVVRMLPGSQALVFTWREALGLAEAATGRRTAATATPVTDLRALARALHAARGTIPLSEPPVRTGPFHWRRATSADPLSIGSGHIAVADHRRVTQQSLEVAASLGDRLAELMESTITADNSAATLVPRRLSRSA